MPGGVFFATNTICVFVCPGLDGSGSGSGLFRLCGRLWPLGLHPGNHSRSRPGSAGPDLLHSQTALFPAQGPGLALGALFILTGILTFLLSLAVWLLTGKSTLGTVLFVLFPDI